MRCHARYNIKQLEEKSCKSKSPLEYGFEKPESDLRDIFDLKTSGREAFLLGCYGAPRAYYFCEKEKLLKETSYPLMSPSEQESNT